MDKYVSDNISVNQKKDKYGSRIITIEGKDYRLSSTGVIYYIQKGPSKEAGFFKDEKNVVMFDDKEFFQPTQYYNESKNGKKYPINQYGIIFKNGKEYGFVNKNGKLYKLKDYLGGMIDEGEGTLDDYEELRATTLGNRSKTKIKELKEIQSAPPPPPPPPPAPPSPPPVAPKAKSEKPKKPKKIKEPKEPTKMKGLNAPTWTQLNKVSDYDEVKRKAKKFLGKYYDGEVPITISTRKGKKYMLTLPNGKKKVHFGDLSREDYTKHKDEKRLRDFQKRNAKWSKYEWDKPAFLSYYLLW